MVALDKVAGAAGVRHSIGGTVANNAFGGPKPKKKVKLIKINTKGEKK